MNKLAFFLAGALLVAGVWVHGYRQGGYVAEAEHNAALLVEVERRRELSAKLNSEESRRLSYIVELQELRRELNAQSSQDPDAGVRSLGAGSMRRLNEVLRAR